MIDAVKKIYALFNQTTTYISIGFSHNGALATLDKVKKLRTLL
jgi:hypothetical protein